MPISNWSVTAADNDDSDASSGINFSEGQAPGQLNDSARAMMAEIKKAFTTDALSTSGSITTTSSVTAGSFTTTGAGSFGSLSASGALTITGNSSVGQVTASGSFIAPTGAAATPSVTFSGNTGTGLYSIGTTQLGIATAGTLRMVVANGSTGAASNHIMQLNMGASNGITFGTTTGSGSLAAATFQNSSAVTIGSIVMNLSGSSVGLNTTSDARLKTVTGSLDAGSVIDQLEPIRYTWNFMEASPPMVGFLAQDLAQVIPEAVTVGSGEPGEEGFSPWSVDASKLVPYLVAELKAVRARLAALEAK